MKANEIIEEVKELIRALALIFIITLTVLLALKYVFEFVIDHYIDIRYAAVICALLGIVTALFNPKKHILLDKLKEIELKFIHHHINEKDYDKKHISKIKQHYINYPRIFFAIKLFVAFSLALVIYFFTGVYGSPISIFLAILAGSLAFFIASAT